MNNTKEIEELIKQSKREKIEIDFTKDQRYDDVTKILEEDSLLDFSHMDDYVIKTNHKNENMEDFDYLKKEEVEPEVEKDIEIGTEFDTTVINNVIEKMTKEAEESVQESDFAEIDVDFDKNYEPNPNGSPIISFKNVALDYDGFNIIKDVSLDVYPGEFVYVVGPSGAGKSSLVKMIYKDVNCDGGSICVDEQDITKLSSSKMPKLRRKIGVVFQDYKLLNNRTVYDNVNYSLEVIGFPAKKRKEQVLKTLNIVGILEQKDKFPNELSGGQQQRVAIARAIVDEPKIIVADEPTGNLDPNNAIIIMEILNKINESGTTIVMATHDVGIVNKYKKRVVLIKDGKVANESKGVYIYE